MRLVHPLHRSSRTRMAKPSLSRPQVERLEDRLLLAAVSWNVDADGLWDVAANWKDESTGLPRVPNSGDDVVIERATGSFKVTVLSGSQAARTITTASDETIEITGGSLTIGETSSVSNVLVIGGSLSATSQLTLTGTSSLSGGSTFSGTIRNEGTLTIGSGDPNLNSATLTNAGTIIHQIARLDFESAGALVNLAGATYDITGVGDGQYFGAFGGQGFTNQGLLRRSAAGNARFDGTPFNNAPAGSVELTVSDARLQFNSGGTWDGGTFTVAPGATAFLDGTSAIFNGTLSGSGAGVVRFSSGTMNVGGAGLVLNLATDLFEFGGGARITGGTVTNTGSLKITDGDPNLNNATLNNSGTIIHQNARLDFESAGALLNLPGATYDITGAGDGQYFGAFGGAGFTNQGLLRRSATGNARFDSTPFHNTSTGSIELTVSDARLQFNSGGTWDGGTFTVAGDATAFLDGTSATFTGTLTGSGAGVVRFAAGTMNVGAAGLTLNFAANLFEFGGGARISDGTVTTTGSLKIADGDPNLNNATLNNSGTIIHQNARLDFESAGALLNLPGATYDITGVGDGQYFGAFSGVGFTNQGLLRRSATGNARFDSTPFNNASTGSVELTVSDARLQFNSGGTWDGGTFTIAAGATTFLDGTSATFSGTLSGSGAGVLRFGSGTVNVGGVGLVLNFAADMFEFGGGARITGGTVTNTGSLKITDGDPNLNNATLNNSGAITHQNARLDFETAGALVNLAGASYDITGAGDGQYFGAFGGSGFTNQGLLKRSAAGIARFDGAPFNNSATGHVEITAGALQLNTGGAWQGGTFTIAASATVFLDGTSATFTGTLSGSGAGVLRFGSGTVNVGGAGLVLNFAADMFEFGGGARITGGTVTNTGSLKVTDGDPNLNTATLNNSGTIIHQNARLDFETAGALVNLAGATYDITGVGDGQYFGAFGGAGFTNQGLLRRSATGNARFDGTPFSNTGTVDVSVGELNLNAPVPQVAVNTLTAGTWQVAAGASLFLPASITTNDATAVLGGAAPQLDGVTMNNGTLSLQDGRDYAVAGNFTNNGSVVFGPDSDLTATGDFTLGSDATLDFQIGGTPASGQFGRLAVTGLATLHGTAKFSLVNGYGPDTGQAFTLANFGSSTGAFAGFDGVFAQRTRIFDPVVSAMTLVLNAVGRAADLHVTGVTTTSANGLSGENVTVNYTVANNNGSTPTFTESWTDSVYLSLDYRYDPSDKLIGRVPHMGVVAGGDSYDGMLTAPVPGVIPGAYRIIVVADSQGRSPDSDRSNNTGAMLGIFTTDIGVIAEGVSVAGTIAAAQDIWFRIDLPALQTKVFRSDFSVAGQAEVRVRQFDVPASDVHDGFAFSTQPVDHEITVPAGRAGTFYIQIHGREAAGAGSAFSFVADALDFSVTRVDRTAVANVGQVTFGIDGSEFTPQTTFELLPPVGSPLVATKVLFVGASQAFATFNLAGAAAGVYDVRAIRGVQTAILDDALNVTAGGNTGQFDFFISAPRYIRPNGRPGIVTVEYVNSGDADLPAQLLILSAPDTFFKLADQIDYGSDGIQFLAMNPDGPAGVLPPGARGIVEVQFLPKTFAAHALTDFSLSAPPADSVIDWTGIKDALRPATIHPDAWEIIFANFLANVGGTVGAIENALSQDLDYFSQLGTATPDLERLLNFELLQSDLFGAISGRFRDGAFGKGFADPNDFQARTQPNGDVAIGAQSDFRLFHSLSDGTFETGAAGDAGVMTLASGIYALREPDGSRYVFRADGKLDFLEVSNGNRLDASYDAAGLLSAFTLSATGDSVQFTYDASGHTTSVDGPRGEHTEYTYDTAGRRLSIATRDGTTQYSYVTAAGSPAFNALASVTLSDGQNLAFSYDARGRIAQTVNGAGSIGYTYPSTGAFQLTDTDGSVTTYFFDDRNALVRQLDDSGSFADFRYNASNRLAHIVASDGTTTSFSYDAVGDITELVGPDGGVTSATYDSLLHRIASITDPRGNATTFQYDAAGQLTNTIFPDGSTEFRAYDGAGRPVSVTTRNGALILQSYDGAGNPVGLDFPDIPDRMAAFDAASNAITLTDVNGVVNFSYDAARRLTHIDYPNGRFVDYTYDAAGHRTQTSDSTGFTANYVYTVTGQLDEIRDGSDTLLVDYTYDSSGRLARKDFANGTATTYTFDDQGQITSVANLASNGAVQSHYDYTYDAAGRRVTMATTEGTATYAYDLKGQLTSVILPDGRTISYQYDPGGNRVVVNDDGSVIAYTTNTLNQYTAVGNAALTYDRDGNVISRAENGSTTSFSYNSDGRIMAAISPTEQVTYQYDTIGNLTGYTRNGIVHQFLYDPIGYGHILAELDGNGNVIAHYLQGDGLEAQIDASGEFRAYGFDGNGNTVQLTNGAGAVINTYSYLPFGEMLAQNEMVANPFKFVGQRGTLDPGNDVNVAGVRLYDPAIGRFLSQDPARHFSANPYTYANNQPTNFIDFTGFDAYQSNVSTVSTYGTNVSVASSTVTLTLNGLQQTIDAAHLGRVNAMLNGGGFLAETEAEVLANTSNRTAIARSNVSQFTDGLGVVTAGVDAYALGNSAYQLGQDPSWMNFWQFVHDAGMLGADAAQQSPHPALKFVGTIAPIVDVGSQQAFGGFFNWYYSPGDPSEIFGPAVQNRGRTRRTSTEQITPNDPNDIIGPTGPGADVIPDGFTPAMRFDGFVPGDRALDYRITFENKATATAPAQVVRVTHQLDSDLDFASFELGRFGFGDFEIEVPEGLTAYQTRVDARALLGVFLDFDASVNLQTGLVTWTLTSTDPSTGDLPLDPLAGFLPPNAAPPEGDGFVTFRVSPADNVPTVTDIHAKATIIFDLEAPLDTPEIRITIDAGAPTSTVAALPAVSPHPNILVSWSGSDDAGSGIASFDVFVSDNAGPFTIWLDDTTNTSDTYPALVDHTYAFFAVATDIVGNVQPTPAGGQATTLVDVAPTVLQINMTPDILGKSVAEVFLTFSEALLTSGQSDPTNVNNYRIGTAPGRDKRLGTPDDTRAALARADYDNASRQVRLVPAKPLKANKLFHVSIISSATLTDAGGNPVDGNADFTSGDNHAVLLGRGTRFSIVDADGDKGSLILAAGGILGFRQQADAVAPSLQLFDVVAGTSALSGKVKKSKIGDGIVAIQSLTGTTGVDLTKLSRCSPSLTSGCFQTGTLAAAVVDSLLAAGELSREQFVAEGVPAKPDLTAS